MQCFSCKIDLTLPAYTLHILNIRTNISNALAITKKEKKVLVRKNLLKPNFNNIVKVHMELLLLGCSQPTRLVLIINTIIDGKS